MYELICLQTSYQYEYFRHILVLHHLISNRLLQIGHFLLQLKQTHQIDRVIYLYLQNLLHHQKTNCQYHYHWKIQDNHRNPVEWSKLSSILHSVGIDYGIFNNGWSYMEGDFNEQGYTSGKTKKFFDIWSI